MNISAHIPIRWLMGLVIFLLPVTSLAQNQTEGSHEMKNNHSANQSVSARVAILNKTLLDQEGKSVQFKTDIIDNNIVVMNFVYTTCTTQCPLNSQILSHVQKNLSSQEHEQVRLVSLSIDPGTDTPERLKNYAEKIGAGPRWAWLTGHSPEVNELLDALGVYTPDFKNHPSVILVGDSKTGNWTRFYGIPDPDQLIGKVRELTALRKSALSSWKPEIRTVATTQTIAVDQDARARAYFTDLPVVTHNGQEKRFYSDMLKDKVVLINLFFGKCENSCPMVHTKLSKLQAILRDYMGKKIFFISITIDPEPDTPEALKKYSKNFNPLEGWSFVTGKPENIRTITRKLGQVNDEIKGHAPFLMVGDVKRARWKKIMPNITNEDLANFLRNLASDSTF